ncbi:phage tail protein [Pseudomonas sp. TH03]|uniref:phage tail protein n=1 Tax=Pseudomonas sp. TH03 TaxID=2796369 RepID=UPI001911CCA4|nr:phage tail protein [Pseudomonas sp. TH03]MBK5551047.1 phage tail protein [Pseudomonas sp. TH03]
MNIDWNKLVTKTMKDAAAASAALALAKVELASRNSLAVVQIARIQDRVDTLGYGIDAGEATEEDETEQATLLINLKVWKAYKFSLGKVTAQPTWYVVPVWPNEPAILVIPANPEAHASDLM